MKSQFRSLQTQILLFSIAALVAACGGGESPNTEVPVAPVTPVAPAPVPSVSVSGPSRVVANTVYTYKATASNATVSAYTWAWGDGSANSTGNPVAKLEQAWQLYRQPERHPDHGCGDRWPKCGGRGGAYSGGLSTNLRIETRWRRSLLG
jgi:hypothetical protein